MHNNDSDQPVQSDKSSLITQRRIGFITNIAQLLTDQTTHIYKLVCVFAVHVPDFVGNDVSMLFKCNPTE